MHALGRPVVAFLVLFVLYQSAEGIGADVLHSFAAQAALMVACVLAAWPMGRWLGFRGYDAYALSGSGWLPWVTGGLLLSGLANLASMALGLGLGIFEWNAGGAVDLASLAPSAIALAALSTFVPSVAEDILTRGFWWRAAGIRWKGPVFVVFSAILYTLNHIYRLENGSRFTSDASRQRCLTQMQARQRQPCTPHQGIMTAWHVFPASIFPAFHNTSSSAATIGCRAFSMTRIDAAI